MYMKREAKMGAALLLLLHTLFGYWVVRGYSVPPILVAGPYAQFLDCTAVAQDLNRIELTYVYHCEMH